MIHLDIESPASRRDLPDLLRRQRSGGGRIVVYHRVVSFIVFSRLSSHLRLVYDRESRALHGLAFFLPTLITGWWSPSGFLQTCYALAHDLLGGVDVTDQLRETTGPLRVKVDQGFAGARLALTIVIIACIFVPALGVFAIAFMK